MILSFCVNCQTKGVQIDSSNELSTKKQRRKKKRKLNLYAYCYCTCLNLFCSLLINILSRKFYLFLDYVYIIRKYRYAFSTKYSNTQCSIRTLKWERIISDILKYKEDRTFYDITIWIYLKNMHLECIYVRSSF